MKYIFLFSLSITIISCCNKEKNTNSDEFWDLDKAKIQAQNLNDSTKWDLELFKNDMEYIDEGSLNPINVGVFPVAQYDLVGKDSFKGLGNTGYYKEFDNNYILYNSFFVKKSPVNEKYIGDKADQVFFCLVVLSDTIDTLNYTHMWSEVISRNHPNYIGEGMYKTKHSKIDYTAFLTADRNSYAIINMRLFDLRLGRIVIIAPQTDKSLRSLQIDSGNLSSNELNTFITELLKKKNVVEFLTKSGNIHR